MEPAIGAPEDLNFIITTTIIVTVIILALVLLVILSQRRGRIARIQKRWTSATGRIVALEVETRMIEYDDGEVRQRFYPRVTYEYPTPQGALRCQTMVIGDDRHLQKASSIEAERDLHARYTLGAAIPVLFNPQNPTEATLEVRIPSASAMLVVIVVLAIIVSAVVIITFVGE